MAGAQRPPRIDRSAWMNARRPVEQRVQALLRQMTLEEKFWQLYMAPGDPRRDSTWRHGAFGVQLLALREPGITSDSAATMANDVQRWFIERTRLGIPALVFEEGVHGLMQRGATVFPAAIGLAATWDTSLVRAVATVIGSQSRATGVRLLLSPVVNLARDPRWGRVEETYGEDSWLSSAMGASYAGALERAGVVATPKHFVANVGDGGRDSYPIALDRATLEDLYFPPFRAAIERGGARAVMAAYNSVIGLPASASAELLTRTLRGAWRFGGVVIADQGGVGGASVLHHTAADYPESAAQALRAGLDVIFQSGAHDAALFWPAFRDGHIARAVVDSAVARVLRLKFSLGLFEQPYAAAHWTSQDPERVNDVTVGSVIAQRAAEASAVLLRNERSTLPLARSMRKVALIGPATLPFGGYTVPPTDPTPIAIAWMQAAHEGESVQWAPGPGIADSSWMPVPTAMLWHQAAGGGVAGLRGEYFASADFDAAPASARVDATIDFRWTFNRPARELGTDWYAVRWSGAVVVPPGSARHLAVEGDDGYRLWVDDSLVIDADRKTSYSLRAAAAPFAPGVHRVRLEYRQTTGTGRIRLLCDQANGREADARIAEAVEFARTSDVAIVTVGVDEGEFRDRSSLRLPGRQEELITRIADTGTPVVVVIVSGGAVITTPWMNRVGAVLQLAYPGVAGASALSRLLHGTTSPAGRLPYTVPRSEGQLPLVYDHLPTGRGDDYVDLTGQPLFPFGFGLSYTTFAYSKLELSRPSAGVRDSVRIRFRLKNTGAVASDEVPQLYVRHVLAPTAQPVLALRGFGRVPLQPGEEREVVLPLAVADLAVRDLDGHRRVLPGTVILYIGASSRDIRLRGTLTIQ